MPGFTKKMLVALLLSGGFVLSAPAIAQTVDEGDTPAATPPAENDSPLASGQPTQAAPQLGQGTKAQAEHSAEATAHKTLNDPNNQLGTSLQGRTRPIASADVDTQKDIASTAQPSQ